MKKAALLFTVALVPVDFIMLFFAGIYRVFFAYERVGEPVSSGIVLCEPAA